MLGNKQRKRLDDKNLLSGFSNEACRAHQLLVLEEQVTLDSSGRGEQNSNRKMSILYFSF